MAALDAMMSCPPPLSPPPLAMPAPTAAPAPASSFSTITAEAIIRAALAANAAAAPGAPPPIDITALLTSIAALPSIAQQQPQPAAPVSVSVIPAPPAANTQEPSSLSSPVIIPSLPSTPSHSIPLPAAAPSPAASYPPPPPIAAAEDPSLLNDWQAFLQQRAANKQQLLTASTTAADTTTPLTPPTQPPAKRQKRLYPIHNCGVCLLPCLPFPSARRHCTCSVCGISVHIECYGISKMSKAHSRALRRRWKCERCKDDEMQIEVDNMDVDTTRDAGEGTLAGSGSAGHECMYCPNRRFALKKASNGRYVHVVCALFLPSLSFTLHHLLPYTSTSMEERSKKKHRSFLLVTGVNDIPAEQYELACQLCDSTTGLCVQCCHSECSVSYHVTCALEHRYYARVEEEGEDEGGEEGAVSGDSVVMKSWCSEHRPADWDMDSEERGVRWVMEGKRLRLAEEGEEIEEREGADWEDVIEEEQGGDEAANEEG